jgi:hypothetical protein
VGWPSLTCGWDRDRPASAQVKTKREDLAIFQGLLKPREVWRGAKKGASRSMVGEGFFQMLGDDRGHRTDVLVVTERVRR